MVRGYSIRYTVVNSAKDVPRLKCNCNSRNASGEKWINCTCRSGKFEREGGQAFQHSQKTLFSIRTLKGNELANRFEYLHGGGTFAYTHYPRYAFSATERHLGIMRYLLPKNQCYATANSYFGLRNKCASVFKTQSSRLQFSGSSYNR